MTETFVQKLMSDEEGRKLYYREDLIFEVTEAISQIMEEKGVNKAELSRLTGVSKSNITQLLSGDHNMRLTTVADLLYMLGSKLTVSAVPIDIDSIVESFTPNQWVQAVDVTVKQLEYQEIGEYAQPPKELLPAA